MPVALNQVPVAHNTFHQSLQIKMSEQRVCAKVQYHVGMGPETASELHDRAYMASRGVAYTAYSSLCGPCPDGGALELLEGPLTTGD